MPLTIEAQKKLLKALKYADADIVKLTGDGENDTDIPSEVKIFDTAEYTQLTTNLSKGVNETSRKAGIEIALKKIKAKTGVEIDVTTDTDIDAFAEAIESHVITKAKIEPNKAKEQWDKEKKELQDKLLAEQKKALDLEADKDNISFETTLLRSFPANRVDTISDDDKLLLIKSKLTKKKDGESEYYEFEGKRLQDKLQNDLPLTDAVKTVFEAKKWVTDGQQQDDKRGRGNGSDKGGAGALKPMKGSEARAAWEKNEGSINPNGLGVNTAEYQAYQTSLARENKEFSVSE